MSGLKQLQDVSLWLFNVIFQCILKRLTKLPFVIAQSVRLIRVITIGGITFLALGLLSITMHIVKVNNAVRETEELAKYACLNIQSQFSHVNNVGKNLEMYLQENNWAFSDKENSAKALPLLRFLKSPIISGITLIAENRINPLYGNLDPSFTNSEWEQNRWNNLRAIIPSELKETNESVTLFMGIERVFRTKQEFDQGQQLTGSLVLVRAWKDKNNWMAAVILLPLKSIFSSLRLGMDQYFTGNYDYLVDDDGFLLAHPRPFIIYGTDRTGCNLKGASNRDEVGIFPINTRDSDWIAGDDILNRAFGSMIRNIPKSVVYKNLQNQPRLTNFRLVELSDFNIQGKTFGVVAGKGLTFLESLTVPLLLESPTSLKYALLVVSSIYLSLLSGWLIFVSKFRSLHRDLLAWSIFMSPNIARDLKLLPIKIGKREEHIFSSMVSILIIFDDDISSKKKKELRELFEELCVSLPEHGWIINRKSLCSVVASRRLEELIYEGESRIWSPTNVVDHLKQLDAFKAIQILKGEIGISSCRILYGVGNLKFCAGRIGEKRKANIIISEDSLDDMIQIEKAIIKSGVSVQGALLYPTDEALNADLQVVGEKVPLNSQLYSREVRKLPLS